MSNLEYQLFYRRHLPHFQPPGATLFITFRLAGSIPAEVMHRLIEERERINAMLDGIPDSTERRKRADLERRRSFRKWDEVLDTAQAGPLWLRDEHIACLVMESLRYRDGTAYDLDAFCIMPNHVHLVFTPLQKPDGSYHAMSTIMHSLKRHIAREANLLLNCEGAFWQHENYDHSVRDEKEWQRIVAYIVNNPVRARLIERAEDWPWTYSKYW